MFGAPCQTPVAQISNLLYRSASSLLTFLVSNQRMKIVPPADWKSALRWLAAISMPSGRLLELCT